MNINELPAYDATDNPTGCCPRFNPKGWDRQDLHFAEKRFAMARTRSVFHIPINMSQVFKKTLGAIEAAGAHSDKDFIVLSAICRPGPVSTISPSQRRFQAWTCAACRVIS